jgi:sulfur carrier protein
MKVWLNDEEKALQVNMTLAQALETWQYKSEGFAVALNSAFVPKQKYINIILKSGDKIDIVTPMQGG